MNKHYVLDTSAFLALTYNERGSDIVADLLSLGQKNKAVLYASFMSFTEVYYTIYRKKGKSAAQETISLMDRLPVDKVHSSDT